MKPIKAITKKHNLSPSFKLFPFYLMKFLNYGYVRFIEGIKSIKIDKTDTLIQEFKTFQTGKSRLIITFRHPTKHDPPILMRLIHTLIPRKAKSSGTRLNKITHSHFLYGQWLMTWANPLVKWLFPGIGAIPVNNRSMDLKNIRLIRDILINGKYPVALAPEGQVTYHNNKCGELEAGISAMSCWCIDDLQKMGSDKKVRILPITLYYDYSIGGEKSLNKVISRISRYLLCKETDLIQITDLILDEIENYYSKYHFLQTKSGLNTKNRIVYLSDTILKRAENYFSICRNGSFLDRTLQIRSIGSKYINTKLEDRKKSTKHRANHMASEAYSILRHMEVVDILQYIDPEYINSNCLNKKIEYSLNLYDLINRFNGGTIAKRFSNIPKTVKIVSGNPIEFQSYNNKAEKSERVKSLNESLLNELTRISNL